MNGYDWRDCGYTNVHKLISYEANDTLNNYIIKNWISSQILRKQYENGYVYNTITWKNVGDGEKKWKNWKK